jgi:hypothetical protein
MEMEPAVSQKGILLGVVTGPASLIFYAELPQPHGTGMASSGFLLQPKPMGQEFLS